MRLPPGEARVKDPFKAASYGRAMTSRKTAIEALAARQFDVVVVGGGITGAGVALDAAARGLTVGLVERRDFASGASGRSSKLLHGGVRCPSGLDRRLEREAASE